MLRALGIAAREARETAGVHQAAIAGQIGRHQSAIARFENAESWPRDPDKLIQAYSDCCGVTQREIWERALDLL